MADDTSKKKESDEKSSKSKSVLPTLAGWIVFGLIALAGISRLPSCKSKSNHPSPDGSSVAESQETAHAPTEAWDTLTKREQAQVWTDVRTSLINIYQLPMDAVDSIYVASERRVGDTFRRKIIDEFGLYFGDMRRMPLDVATVPEVIEINGRRVDNTVTFKFTLKKVNGKDTDMYRVLAVGGWSYTINNQNQAGSNDHDIITDLNPVERLVDGVEKRVWVNSNQTRHFQYRKAKHQPISVYSEILHTQTADARGKVSRGMKIVPVEKDKDGTVRALASRNFLLTLPWNAPEGTEVSYIVIATRAPAPFYKP